MLRTDLLRLLRSAAAGSSVVPCMLPMESVCLPVDCPAQLTVLPTLLLQPPGTTARAPASKSLPSHCVLNLIPAFPLMCCFSDTTAMMTASGGVSATFRPRLPHPVPAALPAYLRRGSTAAQLLPNSSRCTTERPLHWGRACPRDWHHGCSRRLRCGPTALLTTLGCTTLPALCV